MRILTGLGAANLKKELIEFLGIDIPRYIIHKILRDEGLVKKGSRNQKHKWIRYERKHSNSLWCTDWKLLDCGKWLICYQDDASRFVTGMAYLNMLQPKMHYWYWKLQSRTMVNQRRY